MNLDTYFIHRSSPNPKKVRVFYCHTLKSFPHRKQIVKKLVIFTENNFSSMEIVPINSIKLNDNNPRFIRDVKFDKLVKSIKEFPEMLKLRPIVVDEDNVILGGNMRYRAIQKAGHTQVHIERAIGLTEEQKKEFIIKDNVGFGEWDWDVLANEWDVEQLTEWGLDIPNFETVEKEVTSLDYTEDWQISVVCLSERELEILYKELKRRGFDCKIIH